MNNKSLIGGIAVAVAAGVGAFLYYRKKSSRLQGSKSIEGAAEDAYHTMDKHLNHLEHSTEKALS